MGSLVMHYHGNVSVGLLQPECVKVRDLPLADLIVAAQYEFNLPVSEERRLGRDVGDL